MFTAASWHFGLETTVSLHLLYSRTWAFRFSSLAMTVCFMESVAIWFLSLEHCLRLLLLQFPISDTFSLIAALCALFGGHTHQRFKILPAVLLPHSIGVIAQFAVLPTMLFVLYKVPQFGAAWWWLAAALLPTVYIAKDVIRGDCNNLGEIEYDSTKNSKYFIFFCKFGAPFLSFLVVPAIIIMMVTFRTQERSTGLSFADGIWRDLFEYLGLPMSIVAMLWIAYLWASGHATKQESTKSV